MKRFYLITALLCFTLVVFGCGGGGDDNETTGGSGEITTTDTAGDSTSDADTETDNETTTTTTKSSTITLKASSDFACTSNWTSRDGAWGLKAYSGSGTCNTSFKGTSGTYRVSVKVQTEYDGRSPYEVAINGSVIQSGMFPLSHSLGCDCPHETWYKDCPDVNVNIDCGTHTINYGDTISFKGSDDYPCGSDHGSYAKWHSMTFNLVK